MAGLYKEVVTSIHRFQPGHIRPHE